LSAEASARESQFEAKAKSGSDWKQATCGREPNCFYCLSRALCCAARARRCRGAVPASHNPLLVTLMGLWRSRAGEITPPFWSPFRC